MGTQVLTVNLITPRHFQAFIFNLD